jgi:hypothetical protein
VRAGVALLIAGCAWACSSSSPAGGSGGPCNQDPFACPAGQTCWPVDASGNFACIASRAGAKLGDSCVNTADSATCGDAMICLSLTNPAQGTCVADCDNNQSGRSCSANEICAAVSFAAGGPQIHACATLSASDGGAD